MSQELPADEKPRPTERAAKLGKMFVDRPPTDPPGPTTPVKAPSPAPAEAVAIEAKPAKGARKPGKKADGQHRQLTAYVPSEIFKRLALARNAMEAETEVRPELSVLVAEAIEQWLDRQEKLPSNPPV